MSLCVCVCSVSRVVATVFVCFGSLDISSESLTEEAELRGILRHLCVFVKLVQPMP